MPHKSSNFNFHIYQVLWHFRLLIYFYKLQTVDIGIIEQIWDVDNNLSCIVPYPIRVITQFLITDSNTVHNALHKIPHIVKVNRWTISGAALISSSTTTFEFNITVVAERNNKCQCVVSVNAATLNWVWSYREKFTLRKAEIPIYLPTTVSTAHNAMLLQDNGVVLFLSLKNLLHADLHL